MLRKNIRVSRRPDRVLDRKTKERVKPPHALSPFAGGPVSSQAYALKKDACLQRLFKRLS